VPFQRFAPTRLRDLREAAGLSRVELAFACRRTEQSVYLWESGRTTPPTPVVEQIASALGVMVSDLFEEAGDVVA
jgi:transcriptional regulator with XRE-family HTH domain